MKKIIFITISIFVFGLALPISSFAQGMPAPYFAEGNSAGMGKITAANDTIAQNNDGHTAREEAEGKAVWEKLQSKNLNCEDLSDDDFGALGEYFMGQMMGDSHEAMNNMMIQTMGEKGEEQAHIAMGKRMSNCEPDAPMPQNMMNIMMGGGMTGGGMMGGGGNSMMGNFGANPISWFGLGFGWVFMLLFWVLVIVAIVALIKWLLEQNKIEKKSKSALDILKERYARGEIDKKEFEERRKDLI